MSDGDNLILGELRNSATSMTRLVGNVGGNYVFRAFSGGVESGIPNCV